MSEFKKKYSLDFRINEYQKLYNEYKNRIPIICENLPLKKNKFLIQNYFTFGQFLFIIRDKIKCKAEKTIFLFINNIIPSINEQMIILYNKYKDEDGFLYIYYSEENAFG